MSLALLLARRARVAPDRTAIFDGVRPWASHAGWAARSAGLAQRLRAAGLEPGERFLVFMRNHPRYLEILWGAWWADELPKNHYGKVLKTELRARLRPTA